MRAFLDKVHEELGPTTSPYGATGALGISLRSLLEIGGQILPGSAFDAPNVSIPRDQSDPAIPRGPNPVNEGLGEQRILRTSPLTEVPFVCCTDC